MDLNTRPQQILVVDDDAGVRNLFRFVLEDAGYEVSLACDGNEALDQLKKNPADLVITDLVMPGREGLDLICTLRRSDAHQKILAVSGAFEWQFLRVAAMFGAAATLGKPVRPEHLLNTVRTLLAAPAA